jgi:hypothetical protein
MRVECPDCGYYYSDDLILHEGSSFVTRLLGKRKGLLLMHREPFTILEDGEHLQCPQCGEITCFTIKH